MFLTEHAHARGVWGNVKEGGRVVGASFFFFNLCFQKICFPQNSPGAEVYRNDWSYIIHPNLPASSLGVVLTAPETPRQASFQCMLTWLYNHIQWLARLSRMLSDSKNTWLPDKNSKTKLSV